MSRYLLIFLTVFLSGAVYSQDLPDSLSLKPVDTLNTLTIPFDSTGSEDTLSESILDTSKQVISDIDAPINYSSKDSLVYDFKNKRIFLYDEAKLTYKDLKLEAGRITVDQETQVLEAYGIPDTLREGKFTQSPLMFQGSDKYEGAKLTYNFRSQQGSVSMGFSDAEIGYYFGDKIKKVNSEVLFIKNGLYTTSTDREDPEYYFLSPKMKVIPNDKVIAQSVFLYIEGVPVFWIPFGVFPNRTGRSSGLIPPTFGDDATYGKYLSRLGYFWAINDYTDLALTGSYFTKGRYDIYGRFRYALKYNFSGSIDGGYSQMNLGESTDVGSSGSNNWGLNVLHNQQLTPTMRLDANMSFVSGKNYYNTSTNSLEELLQQNVISNVTLSKYWEGSPFSLNMNYYRDQNLLTGDIRERIPLINFSITQTFPFESKRSGYYDKKLYEYFSYSYNGSALNNREKIVRNPNTDSSLITRDMRSGVRHSLNLGFSPKFEFISLIPFFNYTEIWYNKYITKDIVNGSVVTSDANAIKALRYFQTGVNFSTKFVGIFTPRVFGVTGIRHTITPAITYFYQPDFSDPKWGYYKSYTDTSGQQVKYSIFEKEVFGSAPSGESQSIALTLGNVFEMKTRENDTLENKFQLLNLDAGISYNFAADSLNFSELLTSFRTNIGSFLNISGGATFNLYKYDMLSNRRINKFLIDTDGKLADLTNFTLSMSTSFSLGALTSEKSVITPNDTMHEGGDYKDINQRKEKIDEVSFNIPVSGGFGFNYTQSRTNPPILNKVSNISGNIAFNLTEKWRFSVSSNYDIVNKNITAPYVTAYRDLNSWEMNFNWYPAGAYRGFSLEIRIKAPQLRDIKVSKQTNNRGVYN